MANAVEFRLLGPLEVRIDGAGASVGGRAQRTLLALLLLNANAPMSSDRLFEGASVARGSGGDPRHALRVRVSRLRKALGAQELRLVARPPGYVLRVDSGELDLHEFARLVADGRRALGQGRTDRAAALLRKAEALWRGPMLADLDLEPGARTEVERWEEERLAAVEARIGAELELGRHSALTPELDGLVHAHPLREELRAQLMVALYRCGRQADALEAYRSGRSLLVEQLGLEPGPRLTQLEHAILRHDPALLYAGCWAPGPPAAVTGGPREPAVAVLERDRHRAVLAEALDSITRRRTGRVVIIRGEAGAGKTTVARRFADEYRDRARILWGACDPLFTPRPLGPLLDAAELAGGELARVAADDAGAEQILRALATELASRPPAVLIVEDLHWADEATLDVVRLLARRVNVLPLLLMLTYRDDELPPRHPLRVVLGAMASDASILRLRVEPLSLAGVAMLAHPAGVDPEELFRKTSGNPFFVTEAIAAGDQEIPDTVRDAVLARVSRLSPGACALLEAVAVVRRPTELWLLRSLCGDSVDSVGECTNAGVLRAERQAVSFRHELARLAVEESLPADRALELHRRALDALTSSPSGTQDHARLAYHAEAAGDAVAVLAFAPAAAAHASALGAHREAAAQFARALASAGPEVPASYRAELLERRAYECNLSAQEDAAVAAAADAIAIYRSIGDRRAAGNTLRLLSVVLVGRGTISEVEPMAREAVSMLEGLPPGRELALAYATLAQITLNLDDTSSARRWGARAVELGEHLDEPEVLVYALVNIGVAELLDARPTGAQRIDRAIAIAHGRLPPSIAAASIARAHACAAWATTRTRSYAMADRYISAGLELCAEGDLPLWHHYLLAYSSRSHLDQGRWSDATEMAATVVRDPAPEQLARITALVVLGLVRARRGEADAQTPLHDAVTLAAASGMPQAIGPAQAAWSEMTWLRGDRSTTRNAEAGAIRVRDPWLAGELWRWRSRNDATTTPPKRVAVPYGLELTGDWAAAADAWHAIGCPYDEALALAQHDDTDAVRRALQQLRRLGAHAAARIVARRLRTRRAQLRQR